MRSKKTDTSEVVREAKSKLGIKAAEIIVKDLNVQNWNGKKGCCPIHRESTPSFIWCEEDKSGGGNYFKCFGCGISYDIISHFMRFHDHTFEQALKKLCEMTDTFYTGTPKAKDDSFKKYRFPKETEPKSRDKVEKYLARRSISPQTLDCAGIKEDKDSNIVFEYRDPEGTLVNVKYRPAAPVRKGAKMWFQPNADNCPVLFNMHKIDTTKPLIICEGEIDCLSLIESGFTNAVSIPYGANDDTWVQFNYDWLEQFDKIILWYDDDSSGKKAVTAILPRLGRHRTFYVEPTDEIVQNLREAVTQRKIVVSKCDANNVLIALGKNVVSYLIENAKDLPSKRLKFLMDAEEIDVQNMEKVTTGYKELDKKIYGNILPCFSIFTGYTGAGKSTISTQMSVISPVENGYKSMVFSGELHEGQLKSWVLKPLAGREHTLVWKNPDQPDGYTVTREAKKTIEDYYRDKIIHYTDVDDLETSSRTLLEEMEYSYRRYNTKFFLIDNLMCIDLETIGKNECSEWDSQKSFIKQLMKFTNKYSVNTSLIIHPKKPGQKKERSAYELHGASEVANFCHRLYWILQLSDDPEGCNVGIELIKDRTSGKHGAKCKLYYDYPTMRVYSDQEELSRKYSWEKGANIQYPKDIASRLVANQRDQREEVFGCVTT